MLLGVGRDHVWKGTVGSGTKLLTVEMGGESRPECLTLLSEDVPEASPSLLWAYLSQRTPAEGDTRERERERE